MRSHPSKADERLAEVCWSRGLNVSARVIQSMKERGALRRPPSKVDLYPKGTERIVDALVRNGWQRKARQATFLTFMDGHPFTGKGVRWTIGTPSEGLPVRMPTAGKSVEEIELTREEQAEKLADDIVKSRNPYYVRLRKKLRSQGIDPVAAAYDMALAILGGTPPVELERYEPTTDEFTREPAPWPLRMLGHARPLEGWDHDPQHVAQDMRDMYRHIGDPNLGKHLDEALERATEEQMAETRDALSDFRRDVPKFASADDIYGIVGAFLVGLAQVVGTLDWTPQHDHSWMDEGPTQVK